MFFKTTSADILVNLEASGNLTTIDMSEQTSEAKIPQRGEKRTGSKFRQNVALAETLIIICGYLYLLVEAPLCNATSADTIITLRFWILASFGALYLLRLNVMMRWLLPREVSKEEIGFVLLIFVPAIMTSFALGANGCDEDIHIALAIGCVCFYLLGSYLNSGSELQRKLWKSHPENKGKCYTEGLFSLARNINYFGDVVLFSAWALASGRWWNAWAPLFMFLSFVFHHIPEKEAYLEKRYEAEWPAYSAGTKLIPFVY